jgi:ornithine carbamoyltransferase
VTVDVPRHLICSQAWSIEQIDAVINLARVLRAGRGPAWVDRCLHRKAVYIMFNRPSTRSRLSVAPAVVEMGGVPLTVDLAEFHPNEAWEELCASVVTYGAAACIRLLPDGRIPYGKCEQLLEQMAVLSDELDGGPVVSLSHDRCHPCQGMAEFVTLQDALGASDLSGVRLLVMWVRGRNQALRAPTQDTLMMATRRGMSVTLCHPDGFQLDPGVIQLCHRNAQDSGGEFLVTGDLSATRERQDVIYARNWEGSQEPTNATEWYCSREMLGSARFLHPMPIERDIEADREVVDGPASLIEPLIRNKYFVQKAVLALLAGDR